MSSRRLDNIFGSMGAARELAQALADGRRWQALASIERGRTAVRLKLDAE
jgi:hypothetical protein